MVNKDFIKESILRIQKTNEKVHILYRDFKLDMMDFFDEVSYVPERALAYILTSNEENFKLCLDEIQWWLYETTEKVIYIPIPNTEPKEYTTIDLTELDGFIDYLIKTYSTEC